ncbi:hypothetical protein [Geopseudomonas aromaticivorans]
MKALKTFASLTLSALACLLLVSQVARADAAPGWDREAATENELAGYQCAAALMVNFQGAKSNPARYWEVAGTLEEAGKLVLLVGARETGRRTGTGVPLPLNEVTPILLAEAGRLKARWASDRAGVLGISRQCMQWADSVYGQVSAMPKIDLKDITPPSEMPPERLAPDMTAFLDELAAHAFSAWRHPDGAKPVALKN